MLLKGHSQLWDHADLDTTFASLKSVYLNPKLNVRVQYIKNSALILPAVSFDRLFFSFLFFFFLQTTSFWANFNSSYDIILLRSRYDNATPNFCWVFGAIIGRPVQLISEVFWDCTLWRLPLCRHTFASLSGACLRFASLWRTNLHGDSCVLGVHLSNVCWGLLFCLRKAFIFEKFAESS